MTRSIYVFKRILTMFILLFFCLSIVGCGEDKYKKGYKAGYSSGYAEGKEYGYDVGYSSGKQAGYRSGKYDGYEEGKDDGYTDGYASGTLSYVKKHAIPSLGLSIIFLLFSATIYYLFKYFKDPSKRVIDKSTERIEEYRLKTIVKKELVRKQLSAEEKARIKAINLANRVFEKSIQAISDEKSKVELDKLRQEAEEKIFKMQLTEIENIATEYKASIEALDAAKNLSSKEKSELFSDIKDIISET